MRFEKVFVAVGSNLGDRQEHILRAFSALENSAEMAHVKMSQLYETEPWGGPAGQGKYLNAVLELETGLSPSAVFERLLQIEKSLGRERSVKNAPRTMDLDLLFYGREIIDEPGLRVPHPRLHERWFVLRPFCDLAPDFVHPVLGVSVKELLSSLGHGT